MSDYSASVRVTTDGKMLIQATVKAPNGEAHHFGGLTLDKLEVLMRFCDKDMLAALKDLMTGNPTLKWVAAAHELRAIEITSDIEGVRNMLDEFLHKVKTNTAAKTLLCTSQDGTQTTNWPPCIDVLVNNFTTESCMVLHHKAAADISSNAATVASNLKNLSHHHDQPLGDTRVGKEVTDTSAKGTLERMKEESPRDALTGKKLEAMQSRPYQVYMRGDEGAKAFNAQHAKRQMLPAPTEIDLSELCTKARNFFNAHRPHFTRSIPSVNVEPFLASVEILGGIEVALHHCMALVDTLLIHLQGARVQGADLTLIQCNHTASVFQACLQFEEDAQDKTAPPNSRLMELCLDRYLQATWVIFKGVTVPSLLSGSLPVTVQASALTAVPHTVETASFQHQLTVNAIAPVASTAPMPASATPLTATVHPGAQGADQEELLKENAKLKDANSKLQEKNAKLAIDLKVERASITGIREGYNKSEGTSKAKAESRRAASAGTKTAAALAAEEKKPGS